MSTLATVEQVLCDTNTPMSVKDIVELAGDSLPTRSKTPDTVVARDLSMDLKRLGDESRFIRTAPGRYTLRKFVTSGLVKMGDSGLRPLALRHQTSSEESADRAGNEESSTSMTAGASSEDLAPTPVLAAALGDGRRGLLPAQGVSQEEPSRVRDNNSEAIPARQ
ncbi:MAG: hypothetical protein GY811_22235 [Myxococcales bacterium]|nr:hypothetical protein [Myxococcales bacterium]